MKHLFFILFAICFANVAVAQPQVRRNEIAKKNETKAGQLTERARLKFPTAAAMPEDVVWRRDIYRTLDLTDDANSGLYYPVEPIGNQMNLFTYLFKLVQNGYVSAYQYRLDGNESFDEADKYKIKDMLDSYHIFYEDKNGKLKVENSDIPSAEVLSYYIKECSYFDQSSSTFHTKVIAICPVMHRADDFGGAATKYPLFWLKYEDLAPYLSRRTIMTSNLNNAATMSVDDYFTLNKYKGKIYKTSNMLGKTLAQYCTNDTAMAKEQNRIEGELVAFEKHIWGDGVKKDSLDSISNHKSKGDKKVKVSARKNRRVSSTRVSSKSSKSSGGSSSGSAARVTVRRQRH